MQAVDRFGGLHPVCETTLQATRGGLSSPIRRSMDIRSCTATVGADPRLDVPERPDLALSQRRNRFGEVGSPGQLIDPLPAHTEQGTDLVRTDKAKRPVIHTRDYRHTTTTVVKY